MTQHKYDLAHRWLGKAESESATSTSVFGAMAYLEFYYPKTYGYPSELPSGHTQNMCRFIRVRPCGCLTAEAEPPRWGSALLDRV